MHFHKRESAAQELTDPKVSRREEGVLVRLGHSRQMRVGCSSPVHVLADESGARFAEHREYKGAIFSGKRGTDGLDVVVIEMQSHPEEAVLVRRQSQLGVIGGNHHAGGDRHDSVPMKPLLNRFAYRRAGSFRHVEEDEFAAFGVAFPRRCLVGCRWRKWRREQHGFRFLSFGLSGQSANDAIREATGAVMQPRK
jgi:hypothetical protein